jgi:hypothetical protein
MRNGLSAGPLPTTLPGAPIIERACEGSAAAGLVTFSPLVAYSIKANETGSSLTPDVISDDGGHGWMQLTSSFPSNWADPYTNVVYAVERFLLPAEAYWAGRGFTGDDLVRLIAAEYNAGRTAAEDGHAQGDCDLYTTDKYAARALSHYQALLAGQSPFS